MPAVFMAAHLSKRRAGPKAPGFRESRRGTVCRSQPTCAPPWTALTLLKFQHLARIDDPRAAPASAPPASIAGRVEELLLGDLAVLDGEQPDLVHFRPLPARLVGDVE